MSKGLITASLGEKGHFNVTLLNPALYHVTELPSILKTATRPSREKGHSCNNMALKKKKSVFLGDFFGFTSQIINVALTLAGDLMGSFRKLSAWGSQSWFIL